MSRTSASVLETLTIVLRSRPDRRTCGETLVGTNRQTRWEREKERERESESERDRMREGERVSEIVRDVTHLLKQD